MALSFAIGSLCFLIGPFPGYAELVGAEADAITFFVGSIFFTVGGALQVSLSGPGPDRQAAVIQSAGTLFFNVTTFMALHTSVSNADYDRLVWRPDALGSVCFLVSGVIAYRARRRRRRLGARGQSARLHLLRHLGRRGVRRARIGLDPRSGLGELEHRAGRRVLPGLRGRDAALRAHDEVAAAAATSPSRGTGRGAVV